MMEATARQSDRRAAEAGRRSWPYFNTPIHVCLAVVGPICLLMGPLAVLASRTWMRGTAILVLACSIYALVRGYLCRLSADETGVSYRSPLRRVRMAWSAVQRIDRYIPGVGGASYIYVTTRAEPPGGKWDVGPDCVQIQDRPDVLETLEAMRQSQAAA